MNTKITHIFLAGGGSAGDSKLLDKRFVEILDRTKPLVYIPTAMKSRPYQSCLEWFQSVMNPLGVFKIEMWDDLRPRYRAKNSIAGLYLGGGDTTKLLMELRATGFSDFLIDAASRGIPIYGGSAGAIILGKDIRTAPEAKHLGDSEASGLKIVPDFSLVCHYNTSDESAVSQLARKLGNEILAIPDKAGGYLTGNVLTNYGTEPISIFRKNTIIPLESMQSTSLT